MNRSIGGMIYEAKSFRGRTSGRVEDDHVVWEAGPSQERTWFKADRHSYCPIVGIP